MKEGEDMLDLALIFQDHMVLQRDKLICIWGMAEAGGEVSVTMQGKRSSAKAGQDAAGR